MMNSSSVHRPPNAALSRTSSAMSFSSTSEDDASLITTAIPMQTSRRTRKRFTNVQLTMLENLFHQNSHPSREEREAVAKAGGMEIKSVTIWFQNKRQTERKTAATNSGQANTFNEANVQPNITSTIHTFSLHNDTHSTSRTASPPFSASSRSSGYSVPGHHQPSAASSSSSSRPSLDRVASRSELRNMAPRTPSRRPIVSGHLYDSMPSSPLGPPISPPSRDFIDFGKNAKTRRTLEWACAAARLADNTTSSGGNIHHRQHHHQYPSASAEATLTHGHKIRGRSVHRERSHSGASIGNREHHSHHHSRRRSSSVRHDRLSRSSSSLTLRADGSMSSVASSNYHMDVDITDSEEDHEAITPPSTWGKGDPRWVSPISREGSKSNIMSLTSAAAAAAAAEHVPKGGDDDAMFSAALVLCGLGRRA
ncbi:hypothetical protein CPB83DRAFT_872464 [Crepidotus variabilis]|uniref:Homeobox domain-containing protein n=1 Tax=Crepidotus variabilis TaxID=179855 RepID=A0A9P6EVF2_9AGAR|nr:hypothetical protein CPB83DRAFT_872464 [Crepidotus variabilis]